MQVNATEQDNFFNESKQQLQQYIQQKLSLFKMQLVEKMSTLIALLCTGLCIALLVFFILLFVSIMAGYFFASFFNSLYIGFAIVTSFYVVLLGIVLKLKNKLIMPFIADLIVKVVYESTTNNSDNHA